MPFASKAQMRWMYKFKPRTAKKWTAEQKATGKSFKRLPERAGKGPRRGPSSTSRREAFLKGVKAALRIR